MLKKIYISILILFIASFPLHLLAQQVAPSIVWQKCLGGTGNDKATSITRSADGGFIIAGSSYSNDGDVSGHHGATSSSDAWVVKLAGDGHIEWQKSIGGSQDDELDQLINTNDGGYIGLGFSGSNDGDVSGNHGARDMWVVKLDRYGSIQWQKSLGGSGTDMGKNIRQTSDSGFILIGQTSSRDGDVSGNTQAAITAVWVVKLDSSGVLQWQHPYGATMGNSIGYDILPLYPGSYLMAVGGDAGDGDFGNLGGGNGPNSYLVRIGATGQVLRGQWNGQRSSAYGIKQIDVTNFFLVNDLLACYPRSSNHGFSVQNFDTTLNAGQYRETYNYCPVTPTGDELGYVAGNGPGSSYLLNDGTGVLAGATSDPLSSGYHGVSDGFLSSFSPRTWSHSYGGSLDDGFQGMTASNDYTFIAAGYTSSNDGDVSGNHGGYDFWVVKFSNVNTIKGSVYLDYNSNGTKDINEPFVNNVLVQSSKGAVLTGSPTFQGIFHNSVDTGTYTTALLSPLPYYTPVPSSAVSTFSSYNNTDSLSFALQPIPGKRDYLVNANVVTAYAVRPGAPSNIYVAYENAGTDTLHHKSVKFIKDTRLGFVSSLPTPTSISGDTLIWDIPLLAPRDTGSINLQFLIGVPPAVNLGDTLVSSVVIDSTGDLHPADNIAVLKQPVNGSFDPNDKQEANAGIIHPGDVAQGKPLLYTIRFQNTGTDTAFTVILKDTLPAQVIAATFEMVGASHPYTLTIKNGNILTWTFQPIQLPDSNHNQAASHGYVAYRVKPAANLAVGDTIRNSASIYFDFNLPVKTNTQLTAVSVYKLPLPQPPLISGLTDYCHSKADQQITITNIPPPAAQVTVTAKIDNQVLTVAADSSFTIQPSVLAAGPHQIIVVYTNPSGSDTGRWSFTIVAAGTPVVTLSSNNTTITSLANPVILTAANTAGGGTTPLFTFGKDRLFTNVWQAEGILNTLSLDPAGLQIGNNMVYVRMRTSDTCYAKQTAVDSITLIRSSVTGVTDIDYPNQQILAGPNPITNKVTVTGLQSSKLYTLTLVNVNGRQIMMQRVAHQQASQLVTGALARGVYLLRIYDETRSRLIGTIKLLAMGE